MVSIFIKGMIFFLLLGYAAIKDIKYHEVDNWVCVAILIVSLYGTGGFFWGAVVTALPFFVSAQWKQDSIGGGDIKLLFSCGAVLDVDGGLIQVVISLLFIILYAVYRLLQEIFTKGIKKAWHDYKNMAMPFVPFLWIGGTFAFIITKGK